MEKYLEIIEMIKKNFSNPDVSNESNYDLLKSAIAEYSNNEGKIIKEFIKKDQYLIVVWQFDDRFFVSNINKFFVEFDKYKFNDKNAAIFLFKDLTAFSEELSEIEA